MNHPHESQRPKSKNVKRRPGACESCKIKKVKCDGKERCSKCLESGVQCTYLPRKKRRPSYLRQSSVYIQESSTGETQAEQSQGGFGGVTSDLAFSSSPSFGLPTPPLLSPLSSVQANQNQPFPDIFQTLFPDNMLQDPPVLGMHGAPDTGTPMLSTGIVPQQTQQLDLWNNAEMNTYQPDQDYVPNSAQLPSTAFEAVDIVTTYPPGPVNANTSGQNSFSTGVEDNQLVAAVDPATDWSVRNSQGNWKF